MKTLFLCGLLLGGSALAANRSSARRSENPGQPDLRISQAELTRLHADIDRLERENRALRQAQARSARSEPRPPNAQPPRATQGAANAH